MAQCNPKTEKLVKTAEWLDEIVERCESHLMNENDMMPAIGVIGGSGLYEMEGLEKIETIEVDTPFGAPSDRIVSGVLGGRKVYFLPRHGAGHRLMPHEINHRANIWAMRSLGVRWLISVSAVGSLREEMAPRDIVVPDQLIDRTASSTRHTFFGKGIVAHVSFADPYCYDLRQLLVQAAQRSGANVHSCGTYLCMNGPAFSTRAESHMHRMMGADIIGMTNAPEARLCREAEIAAASLALVTDYDCWRQDEAPVDVDTVIENMKVNSGRAVEILRDVIARIPTQPTSTAHSVLDAAIFTPKSAWPVTTAEILSPILGRFGAVSDRIEEES